MAETENKGFIANLVEKAKSFFGKDGDAAKFTATAREKIDGAVESVRGGEHGEKLNEVSHSVAEKAKGIGEQLKGIGGNLGNAKEAFGQMDKGTKATAIGGAGVAAEGAISTVRNMKNKQFGRAAFAAARTALGAVATVAAFKAQSQGQGIGEFTKHLIDSRKGGAAKSGPSV